MITRKAIETAYDIEDGVIVSEGMFYGTPFWVPWFWELALDGCADARDGEGYLFYLDGSELDIWPELAGIRTVRVEAQGKTVWHQALREAA